MRFILIFYLAIILAVLSLFTATSYQHFFYGGHQEAEFVEVVLDKDAIFYTEPSGSVKTVLKAGTKVKASAYHTKDRDSYLLVETKDGRRGVIYTYPLPVNPDLGWDPHLNVYKMSMWRFADECMEKRFDEFDGKYRRTVFLSKHPNKADSVTVSMPFALWESGTWKLYKPQVTYVNGVAKNINYVRLKGKNRLFLNLLPQSENILEHPVVERIISGPEYKNELLQSGSKVMYYLSYPIKWIGNILYIALIGFIPVFIMILLLIFIPVFRIINNTLMKILLIGISIGWPYIWWLINMMEGYGWWYTWFPFLFNSVACIALSLYIVKYRCKKCRHVGTVRLLESTFMERFTRQYEETEKRYFVHRNKEMGVKRTTEYLVREGKEDEKEVFREWDEKVPIINESGGYHIDTYNSEYNVDKYKEKYKCRHCGYEFEDITENETLISKTKVGRKTVINYQNDIYEDTSRRR